MLLDMAVEVPQQQLQADLTFRGSVDVGKRGRETLLREQWPEHAIYVRQRSIPVALVSLGAFGDGPHGVLDGPERGGERLAALVVPFDAELRQNRRHLLGVQVLEDRRVCQHGGDR